jgi:hypothetical protein
MHLDHQSRVVITQRYSRVYLVYTSAVPMCSSYPSLYQVGRGRALRSRWAIDENDGAGQAVDKKKD